MFSYLSNDKHNVRSFSQGATPIHRTQFCSILFLYKPIGAALYNQFQFQASWETLIAHP